MNDNSDFVIGVQFTRLGKTYHFKANEDRDLVVNDVVLVETSRGLQLGHIVGFPDPESDPSLQHIKSIICKASEEDLITQKEWLDKEDETTIQAKKCLKDHGYGNLKVIDSEYGYQGKNLTILISSTSDQKINTNPIQDLFEKDFPESQITVRQVGPRDVAKIYGGIGACGLPERCCSKFLTNFSSISIKMAKSQEISLTPEEITGMCGRLRCCLMYEYEQYEEGRKGLPKKNKWVETPEGVGRVSVVLPLRGTVLVSIPNNGFKEFAAEDVKITQKPTFPSQSTGRSQTRSNSGDSQKSRGRSNTSDTAQKTEKTDDGSKSNPPADANKGEKRTQKRRYNNRRGNRKPKDSGNNNTSSNAS